jgi:cytochrome c oxidase subunit 4
MSAKDKAHHLVPASLYVKIWIALILLTAVTVGVSFLEMKKFTVFTAMLIASVKALLVLLYFMHIRYEKIIYPVMIGFVFVTYSIFIILTFSDYSLR